MNNNHHINTKRVRCSAVVTSITFLSMVLILFLYEEMVKLAHKPLTLIGSVWCLLEGVDQKIVWGILVIILFFVFILRNLFKQEEHNSIKSHHYEQVNENQLQTWVSSIKPVLKNKNSYYSKWALARDFQSLLIISISEQLGITPAKARDLVKRRDFEAPQEIHDYLQAGGSPLTEIKVVPYFLRRFRKTPLDLNPEIFIQFIEEQYGNDY